MPSEGLRIRPFSMTNCSKTRDLQHVANTHSPQDRPHIRWCVKKSWKGSVFLWFYFSCVFRLWSGLNRHFEACNSREHRTLRQELTSKWLCGKKSWWFLMQVWKESRACGKIWIQAVFFFFFVNPPSIKMWRKRGKKVTRNLNSNSNNSNLNRVQ